MPRPLGRNYGPGLALGVHARDCEMFIIKQIKGGYLEG